MIEGESKHGSWLHAVGFVMKKAVNEVGSFIQWVLWLIKGLVGHLLIDLKHI